MIIQYKIEVVEKVYKGKTVPLNAAKGTYHNRTYNVIGSETITNQAEAKEAWVAKRLALDTRLYGVSLSPTYQWAV